MEIKTYLDLTNHFQYLKSRCAGNSGQLLCGLFALPAPTPEQCRQPTASTVGGAPVLLRPPAPRSARASVGRKNLGGKGAAAARMRTSSLWPGGWWWGLAFIDFCYFLTKHPPLCLATGGSERSEQRGVFGVREREERNRQRCLAWETSASLSCSLRFLLSHQRAGTLLCILLYFTASI